MTNGSATTAGSGDDDARTRRFSRRLRALLAIGLIASFAACAAVPDNGIAERLDERTGTTVTAMQRAIELVSTEPRGSGDPFAYLAPIETNRMGRREIYLWVAIPDERGGAAMPVVLVGGAPLQAKPLEPGTNAGALGLGSFPYSTPAPWSAISVFSIDEAALRSLAAAGALEVSVRYADGRVVQFSGTPQPADILRQFLASLGL